MKIRIKSRSTTKANEHPLKSKFNAGHVPDQVYCEMGLEKWHFYQWQK